VQLLAPAPDGDDEVGVLEQRQMFGHCLSRHVQVKRSRAGVCLSTPGRRDTLLSTMRVRRIVIDNSKGGMPGQHA
jgi:hypothetical protein